MRHPCVGAQSMSHPLLLRLIPRLIPCCCPAMPALLPCTCGTGRFLTDGMWCTATRTAKDSSTEHRKAIVGPFRLHQ